MTETLSDPTLTALDRCAGTRGGTPGRRSGGELMFCAHHAAAHREKLAEVASHIHDETAKLHEAP